MSNNPNHFNRKNVNPGSFRILYTDTNKPTYVHRCWMNGCVFVMNRKKYKIICGTWLLKDGICVDAVKFEEVRTDDYPIAVYIYPETEFFKKVPVSKIQFQN